MAEFPFRRKISQVVVQFQQNHYREHHANLQITPKNQSPTGNRKNHRGNRQATYFHHLKIHPNRLGVRIAVVVHCRGFCRLCVVLDHENIAA